MKRQTTRSTIQAFALLGMKNTSIASVTGANIKTVEKWKKRNTIEDKKRQRQPSVLVPEVKEAIAAMCRDCWGMSTRKIAKTMNASNEFATAGIKISKSCVTKYLRSTDWGRVAYRIQTKPLLTQRNITDRFAFSIKVVDGQYCAGIPYSSHLLEHLLFTDESIVELYPKPNKQNMRIRTSNPDDRVHINIPKNGLKIMIAGGMSAHGLTGLHIVEQGKTVNGDYYRTKILPVYFSELTSGMFPNPNQGMTMHLCFYYL